MLLRDSNEQRTVRASVAQAFDFMGQGLVLRGDPFIWDKEKQGASPHLTKEAASALMKKTLAAYLQTKGIPPKRVVVHKSSEFWGAEHGQYNELEGFFEGIEAVFARCQVDLVALRQTGLHLFREGNYPPLRGTYFTLGEKIITCLLKDSFHISILTLVPMSLNLGISLTIMAEAHQKICSAKY